MIGNEKVVIDGFGNVPGVKVIARLLRDGIYDVAGVRGIIAADVIEKPYVSFFEDLKDIRAVCLIGLVTA